MKIKLTALLLCFLLLFGGCGRNGYEGPNDQGAQKPPFNNTDSGTQGDLGDDNQTFGEDLQDTHAYDGYFEGESQDLEIKCVSGTKNAYKLIKNTLTFTTIHEKSAYSISGTFSGNIVIDVGDDYKFDLEFHGVSIVCNTTNPITVKSGDEVSIKAKEDTENYIYDTRAAIDETDKTLYSAAIHSEVDLEIGGKGALTVLSENNNGIHSKDDLKIKNLTLFVACIDNSLKGNDSVEIKEGNTTLIASGGDCIKTSNSDISKKGNQRGNISILGGTHTLYAACDGMDAAHNVTIEEDSTVLNIYTDKYSNYSGNVTANSSDVNYIRFTNNQYFYSVKYYSSDNDFIFVNAEYDSKVSNGRTDYYYYAYPKMPDYAKQQFFIYEKESERGQEEVYLVKSDYLTPNSGCDTFALTPTYNGLSYQWTNYTTKIQDSGFGGRPGGFGGGPGGFGGGPGGFNDGNTNKGDYSTKGIKGANEIIINGGTINIKSHDDAIHASNDQTLENGTSPLGNVTISGGTITAYSNDDGIHADGTLYMQAGTVSISHAYEGLEGTNVNISGGCISIHSDDDGINATATSGTAVEISGGTVYIYCAGDGIDSNSRASNVGIVFSGGKTVVISNSGMNSAIDTESGYTYTAGLVVAVMPRGGMSSEAMHCSNFSSIGKSTQSSLTSGHYLVVDFKDITATIQIPVSLSAMIITLGDSAATVTTETSTRHTLDINGVSWN